MICPVLGLEESDAAGDTDGPGCRCDWALSIPDQRPLLAVENLSVQFLAAGAPVSAVTDVNFELKRGEVLCLLGESGCGKT